MQLIQRTLRVSALALPIAMAAALVMQHLHELSSWRTVVASLFVFAIACWIARFQWRRSFDLEAVFVSARVHPTDSEATKLSTDVVSLLAGAFLVLAVFLKF